MNSVNRAVLILNYKDPAIEWINQVFPEFPVLLQEVNKDRTAYLTSNKAAETEESINKWLKKNFKSLFEEELASWCTDTDLWPSTSSFKTFNSWFSIEYHSVVFDTLQNPIVRETF